MEDLEVLGEYGKIRVIKDKDGIYTKHINPFLIILPYVIDQEKNPVLIGITENNQAIIKECDLDGSDFFEVAKELLLEKSGFRTEDDDRWQFLGPIKLHTGNKDVILGFGVDITGLVSNAEHDPLNNDFKLVSVPNSLSTNDCFLPILFVKCFKDLLNKNN